MNFKEKMKEVANKSAKAVLKTYTGAVDYVDEHPGMAYWGVLGLSCSVGYMLGDIKNDLNEIKDKLD